MVSKNLAVVPYGLVQHMGHLVHHLLTSEVIRILTPENPLQNETTDRQTVRWTDGLVDG